MIQKKNIVKCLYLCASAAMFDNKVIHAKNQLRKVQKTIKHFFARLNNFEKKLVTTIAYIVQRSYLGPKQYTLVQIYRGKV